MVTFDKGGRVARLEPGVLLDARQTGILFARLGRGHTARLLEWDRTRNPAATKRIGHLIETKGVGNKQTLLLALSMGVLLRFHITTADGTGYVAEGDRTHGFRLEAAPRSDPASPPPS